MKKHKRLYVLIIGIVVLALIATAAYFLIYKKVDLFSNEKKSEYINSKKLLGKYANILSGNCYMRYKGTFKDSKGVEKEATIEMSKKDDKTSMTSEELGIGYIDEGIVAYSISHTSKLVIKVAKSSDLTGDVDEYVFLRDLSNLEKEYVKSGKEKVDGVKYDFEEYKENDQVTTKYYFLNSELTYIRRIRGDFENLVRVIDINSTPKESMFKIPRGYRTINV